MAKANPNLIPRNHQIEFAITAALNSDFDLFHRLNKALKSPYEKTLEYSDLEAIPTEEEEVLKHSVGPSSCISVKHDHNIKRLFKNIFKMTDTILQRCEQKSLRMTSQRKIIAQVLEDAADHPDVEELYKRASKIDLTISIATVYRTVKLFDEAGILDKLEFGDGRARYEDAEREHHDHLIDINSGRVIEFMDSDIEKLQEKIAKKLGYKLMGHKLELYGVPLKKS